MHIDLSELLIDYKKKKSVNLETPLNKKRVLLLYILIFTCLILIFLRCGYLQIVKGAHFQKMAQQNTIRTQKISAPRGLIYDKNRILLAQNRPFFFVDNQIIPLEEALQKQEQGKNVEQKTLRYYPYAKATSHLIGYTDNENIGRTDLELFYNDVLTGTPGQERLQVSADGQIIKQKQRQEPIIGQSLILNIDLDLQKFIYENLPEGKKASVIVLNPQNGAILALVSAPSFDPNLFTTGIAKNKYEELINNPDKPLFNRPISGRYAPGSVIKPLIALAGLEEDVIDPEEQIETSGQLRIQDKYNPDRVYIFPDWKDHGQVDLFKAIAQSCNVYFYKLGEKLGFNNTARYLKKFGLEDKTNIDLPGEAVGFVPIKGWLGDLYHISIGQGDLIVTPMQVASYTMMIANGGTMYQPQIVDKIIDNQGNELDIKPSINKNNIADQENIDLINKAMSCFTDYSLGYPLRDLPIKIAGKTGTAQYGPKPKNKEEEKYHSWFTSFYQDKLVVTVLIEQGESGYATALPVAKKVYQWYVNKKELNK